MKTKLKSVLSIVMVVVLFMTMTVGCATDDEKPISTGSEQANNVDKVKIGIIEPFTGGQAVQGETVRRAYEYTAKQINESGGIKSLGGAKLELIFADHQSANEVGMSETERLITQEKVSAVMGACNSGVVMAATQVTERMEVPFIVDVPAGIEITERGYDYVFRTSISALSYGDTFVDFTEYLNKNNDMQINSVATFFDDTEAGRSLVNTGIEQGAENAGMKVVASQGFPTNVQDTSTFWGKIKASDPDVVATHISGAGTAIIATNQAADLGVNPQAFINANGALELPNWQNEVGELADGWFIMLQWNADLPGMEELANDYLKETGAELDGFGALAMQALKIVKVALEEAGSADPKVLRDALSALEIGPGPDLIMPWTEIKYDDKGQNVGARNIVVQWQEGKRITVFPEEVASASPIAPYEYY